MSGRHSQKEKTNAPLIILIIAAVLVISAVVVAVFWLMNGNRRGDKEPTTQPVTTLSETSSAVEETTQTPSVDTDAEQTSSESVLQTEGETGIKNDDEKIDVAVPTEEGAEVSYFNATFIPNGVVEDSYTGGSASLREVFGSGYTDGVITFNSDGTFTDTLSSSSVDSGAYVVQNGKIIATYTNDKNMEITVTSWDGNTPAEFYINFGGYIVYFG